MITAPALAARAAKAAEILAPAEESTMSVPAKSKASSDCTVSTDFSPNDTWRPTDRSDASATISSAGKSRSASVCSISRPTFPVAPTTATL